ncbi:hypothetical protein WJE45_24110, partial [Salmonella enterica subsp. enterica serovar Corvallis]
RPILEHLPSTLKLEHYFKNKKVTLNVHSKKENCFSLKVLQCEAPATLVLHTTGMFNNLQ